MMALGYIVLAGAILMCLRGRRLAKRPTHAEKIKAEADRLVGISASSTPVAFRLALGIPPTGGQFDIATPFTIDPSGQTHGVSTCALVAREILRRAGVAIPSLEQPYVIASGISDVSRVAEERGVMFHGPWLHGIGVGDLILWPDHVATVTAVVPTVSQSVIITTVDGGMVDVNGLQAIGRLTRSVPYAQAATLPLAYIRTAGLPWSWSEA